MYYDERDNELKINDEVNTYDIFNDIKKWNNEFNIENININNYRKDISLYNTTDGFNKGNMFKNEYVPYKNYSYKVVVNSEKDKLLLIIQELTFKALDLSLYLDIYSNDENIYKEFKNTIQELDSYKDKYEKEYGPLCVKDTKYYESYKWNKNWFNGGKYNV